MADAITGAKIDPSLERAECELDEAGHTLRWRVWRRGGDGRWRPRGAWRTTSHAKFSMAVVAPTSSVAHCAAPSPAVVRES